MTAIADVVPGVVAQITGEPIPDIRDADAEFLRACASQVRRQDLRVAMRLERIAERLTRAVGVGQLLPVRDAD